MSTEKKEHYHGTARAICLLCLGILLVVALVACSGSSSNETPGATSTPTPTSTATATVTPTPTPTVRPTPMPLFLEITTPKDESVVTTSVIEVKGKALPTAVLSVNGVLISVKEDGSFTTSVSLEEGPNVIEVVTSDIGGSEIGNFLMVTYLQ